MKAIIDTVQTTTEERFELMEDVAKKPSSYPLNLELFNDLLEAKVNLYDLAKIVEKASWDANDYKLASQISITFSKIDVGQLLDKGCSKFAVILNTDSVLIDNGYALEAAEANRKMGLPNYTLYLKGQKEFLLNMGDFETFLILKNEEDIALLIERKLYKEIAQSDWKEAMKALVDAGHESFLLDYGGDMAANVAAEKGCWSAFAQDKHWKKLAQVDNFPASLMNKFAIVFRSVAGRVKDRREFFRDVVDTFLQNGNDGKNWIADSYNSDTLAIVCYSAEQINRDYISGYIKSTLKDYKRKDKLANLKETLKTLRELEKIS